MEQPGPKQRSPWLYVFLGCFGFAALSCLGVVAMFGFGFKKVVDMGQGVTNPSVREENAKKMLGEIPSGYVPFASLSFFGVVETTLLTDGTVLPDGGVEPGPHLFNYLRVMANEQNQQSKEFFTKGVGDLDHLKSNNVDVDARDVFKRGNLTLDGRRIYYVVSRGNFGMNKSPERGLNTTMMFDCPSQQLHLAVWSMRDPDPQKPDTELDLTGTVADEAELSRFLKPVNPCH